MSMNFYFTLAALPGALVSEMRMHGTVAGSNTASMKQKIAQKELQHEHILPTKDLISVIYKIWKHS